MKENLWNCRYFWLPKKWGYRKKKKMLDDIDEFVRIGININFDMTRYIRDFRN